MGKVGPRSEGGTDMWKTCPHVPLVRMVTVIAGYTRSCTGLTLIRLDLKFSPQSCVAGENLLTPGNHGLELRCCPRSAGRCEPRQLGSSPLHWMDVSSKLATRAPCPWPPISGLHTARCGSHLPLPVSQHGRQAGSQAQPAWFSRI